MIKHITSRHFDKFSLQDKTFEFTNINRHLCSIVDIDECVEVPEICKNGQCQNTFGSYICICPPGYRLDHSLQECVGKICREVTL